MTALRLGQGCGPAVKSVKNQTVTVGRGRDFFAGRFAVPLATATVALLRYMQGYEGSGWKDVKEQYCEVNKRQEIALAREAGKREDQAGGLQGGPVVPKCCDVDRNRRACKG
jgi:hypothetical protein